MVRKKERRGEKGWKRQGRKDEWDERRMRNEGEVETDEKESDITEKI
jgi:hypothetical protein